MTPQKRPAVPAASPAGSGKIPKNQNAHPNTDMPMKDTMECIVCMDFPASPIQAYRNGHLTCGLCNDELKGKPCSLCRTEGLTVSPFAELVAKKLEMSMPCQHVEDGCKEMVKSTELLEHVKKNCPYRLTPCLRGTCNGRKVPLPQYFKHLKEVHRVPEFGSGVSAYYVFFGHGNDNFYCYGERPPNFLFCNGKWLLLRRYKDWDSAYFWVEHAGTKEEAIKYQLSVRLVSRNTKNPQGEICIKAPALPVGSGFGPQNPSSPSFAKFDRATLMSGFAEEVRVSDRDGRTMKVMRSYFEVRITAVA